MKNITLPKENLRKVLAFALNRYDLDILRIRFFTEGDHSLFILYASEQKYVMKISQNPPEITKEIYSWVSQLSEKMDAKPPCVLAPILTHNKECGVKLIYNLKEVYCTVFPWLEGKALSHCLSLPNMERWGTLMAKIHEQSQHNSTALASSHLKKWNEAFYQSPNAIDSKLEHLPAESRLVFKEMAQRVSKDLTALWEQETPIRIHGGLHPRNVKVYKQQLVAFDFDDAMWGYPVQDIAIALTGLRHTPRFAEFLSAFRKGYTEYAQWPEAYPGHLNILFMGRLLWTENAVLDAKSDNEESLQQRLTSHVEEFKTVLSNL